MAPRLIFAGACCQNVHKIIHVLGAQVKRDQQKILQGTQRTFRFNANRRNNVDCLSSSSNAYSVISNQEDKEDI